MFSICWYSFSWFIMKGFYFTFHIITMPLLSVKGFCVRPGFLEYYHKHSYTNRHLFSMYRRDWQCPLSATCHRECHYCWTFSILYPGVPYSISDGLARCIIGCDIVNVYIRTVEIDTVIKSAPTKKCHYGCVAGRTHHCGSMRHGPAVIIGAPHIPSI